MQRSTASINAGPLSLAIAELGSTRVISLSGELDLSNVSTVETLLEELGRDGVEAVVLDLEALEFIDSTGMALLVNSHKRLNRDGRPVLRIVPSRSVGVRRVLAATGLDKTLPFAASNAEANGSGP